jgi:hypothetical protein
VSHDVSYFESFIDLLWILLFIINREREHLIENLYMSVGVIVVYYESRKRELKKRIKRMDIGVMKVIVYYESITREPKRRVIYEYRCDQRLKRG